MKALLGFALGLFVSITSRAEMGFYKLSEVPEPIQAVAPSVIQVVMPEGRIIKRFELSDYDTPEFEAELEATKSVHWKSQMKFCKTKRFDICLVYQGFALSSGFVVKDSHHIATNRHVVWTYIRDLIHEYTKRGDSYEAAFKKAATRPFVIKLAKNLKKIPTINRQVNALEWFEDESLSSLAQIDSHEFPSFLGSDIIVIKIDESVGLPPVRFAKSLPDFGETLYILGYPVTTTDRRSSFGKGESNGIREISVSRGQRISVEEGLKRLSAMNSKIRGVHAEVVANPALGNKWRENVLLTDADAAQGSSGGPVVNAQGEVVAIQSARLIEYRGTQPGLSITFTSPLVQTFVESAPLRLVPALKP